MPMLQQDLDLTMDFPFISEGLDLFENLNLWPLGELWITELESLSDAWNLQEDSLNPDCKRGSSMIRVHDCMWAGTCGSKDHVGRKPNETTVGGGCRSWNGGGGSSSGPTTTQSIGSVNSCSPPIRVPPNSRGSPVYASSPRTAVKKPSFPAPTKVLHRPDTPQSEDDLSKTPEDHELYWSRGVAVSEITGQRRTESANPAATIHSSVSFDHNYNTKKPDDLGVQTPSDSEDEGESEEEDSQSSEVEEQEEEEEEEEEEDDEDEEEEIDVVSLKPCSPPRKKMVDRRLQLDSGQEWRRPETVSRPEMEVRLGLSRQEQTAVRYASHVVSKRIAAETARTGRGRQKRKRLSSDEEDVKIPTVGNKGDVIYKPNYRRATTSSSSSRPRNTTRRKYTTPGKKTRISTDSETDSTEKRSQHNDMERKRRIDLRNAFEDLRTLVPSLADARRAAKVAILRDAASYCHQLTSNSKTLQSQVSILSREQDKLRSNLSKLRRLIANKHVGSNAR